MNVEQLPQVAATHTQLIPATQQNGSSLEVDTLLAGR